MRNDRMPTEKTETRKKWICDVCGSSCPTKKDALKCERRKPLKEPIYISGDQYGYEWDVGDLLIVLPHDHSPKLVKITGVEQEGHEIIPIGQTAGCKDRIFLGAYSDTRLLCVVDDKVRKQLLDMIKKEGQ